MFQRDLAYLIPSTLVGRLHRGGQHVLSFEAKLKRGFAVAALTTEQLRDTNIYVEKPHTHRRTCTGLCYIDMEKQDTRPHSYMPLHERTNTGKIPALVGRGGGLMQRHTHIQMVAAGQTP